MSPWFSPACVHSPYIIVLHQQHTFPRPAPRTPHPDSNNHKQSEDDTNELLYI